MLIKEDVLTRSISVKNLKEEVHGVWLILISLNTSIAIFTFVAHAHDDETTSNFWKCFTELHHSPQITELKDSLHILYVWKTNHPAHINC